uniref:Uncharacterized protein n=1 Tax=Opuntia streptacantha TaxID=393608 RepID=A0A7C8ZHN7_OPUST
MSRCEALGEFTSVHVRISLLLACPIRLTRSRNQYWGANFTSSYLRFLGLNQLPYSSSRIGFQNSRNRQNDCTSKKGPASNSPNELIVPAFQSSNNSTPQTY